MRIKNKKNTITIPSIKEDTFSKTILEILKKQLEIDKALQSLLITDKA